MALKYPLLIIILPIIIIGYLFYNKKKELESKKGSKIANTLFVKNTTYYKKLLKSYNFYKTILYSCFIIAIISSIILCSRLQKVETNNVNEYKRDIFLCMDVSASVDDLNIKLIDNLKETVNSLQGERFGISIFNTTSVLVSPLTDDYDYIISSLNEIENSIKANNSNYYTNYLDDDFYYIRNYIYSGTIEGNEERGSSLIGDGLASCIYSFPKLEEEKRSRIIIFSTDNELAGTPLITLDKAAQIGKKKQIIVYGIGTTVMKDKDRKEFKSAVELTNGKFYEQSQKAVKNIVNDIEKTSKSLVESKFETNVLNYIATKPEYMNRVREGFYAVMHSPGGYGVGYIDDWMEASGKTGTSQSFIDTNNDGVIDTETITSTFIGYMPTNAPKVSFVVTSPDSSHPNSNIDYRSLVTNYLTREIARKYTELYGLS